MIAPLHKAPHGVLGAFDLKVLGQNPDKFGDTLIPTSDVLDFYLARNLDVFGPIGTITNPATSALAGEAVPQGECWRVFAVHAQAAVLNADAANVYTATINITPPSAAVLHVISTGVMVGPGIAGATNTRYWSYELRKPLVLPPGWRVGVGVFCNVTPAVSTAIAAVGIMQRIEE